MCLKFKSDQDISCVANVINEINIFFLSSIESKNTCILFFK